MKFLKSIPVNDLLFIDIETVPITNYLQPNTQLWDSWDYKVRHNRDNNNFEGTLQESFLKHAALYAEFSKIVTICIGIIRPNGKIVVKSFTNHDESILLNDFCTVIDGIIAKNKNTRLAGHAIIGFDIPFIMRRCIVHQIELPLLIDTGHLKPWEVTAIDTLSLWKGTGFSGTSLINICTALGISSPKDEMEGEETYEYYYGKENGIELIEKYCVKDVLTVANVIRKMRYEPLLEVDTTSAVKTEAVGVLESINNTKKITVTQKAHLKKVIDNMDDKNKSIANELLNIINN